MMLLAASGRPTLRGTRTALYSGTNLFHSFSIGREDQTASSSYCAALWISFNTSEATDLSYIVLTTAHVRLT